MIKIDKIKIYLNPKANRKIISLNFFILSSFLLCLLSYILYILFNKFSIPDMVKNIIYGFSYLAFISVAMAVYGSETGDFIQETKYHNTTLKCTHKEALSGLFSLWFAKNGICLIVQIVFYLLFAYKNIQDINFIILFFVVIIIEFACYAIPYMMVNKNDFVEIGIDDGILFYFNNLCRRISYRNTIITIMPNNDILLRDKRDFSYTSKMEIIKVKDIKYIKINNLILRFKNNQWVIDC